MLKSQATSLFSALTQVDRSTSRRYGGTGLGLFMCNGLVELPGGTVQLDSDERTGTRIQVILLLKFSANSERKPPTLTEPVNRVNYDDGYEPLTEKRHVQMALSGSCVKARSTGDCQNDDRPDKALQSISILAVDDQSIHIDLMMQYFDYLNIRGIYVESRELDKRCAQIFSDQPGCKWRGASGKSVLHKILRSGGTHSI